MKAQTFAAAAALLIPSVLSAEPKLRGVILAADYENQPNQYDSEDKDRFEDFDTEAEDEEEEFDNFKTENFLKYRKKKRGRKKKGGGACTWTDNGCVPKSGGSAGKAAAPKKSSSGNLLCVNRHSPKGSVCYGLCRSECGGGATPDCQWSRAAGGFCDGGY